MMLLRWKEQVLAENISLKRDDNEKNGRESERREEEVKKFTKPLLCAMFFTYISCFFKLILMTIIFNILTILFLIAKYL